jgi:hypothetical protein
MDQTKKIEENGMANFQFMWKNSFCSFPFLYGPFSFLNFSFDKKNSIFYFSILEFEKEYKSRK